MYKETTYILTCAPNASELPRAMALDGADCFDVRILSPASAAREALCRLGGDFCRQVPETDSEPVPELASELASSYAQRVMMLESIPEDSYFERTLECARMLCGALTTLRSLFAGNQKDERRLIVRSLGGADEAFMLEKNRALLEIYDNYMELCSQKNISDGITLMRRAISSAKPIPGRWIELAEFPLSPLEHELAQRLSDGGLETMSVGSLLGLPEKFERSTGAMIRGYGETNECEAVLSQIAKEGLPLDSVTVAVTDTRLYPQIFSDIMQLTGISVSFGCGLPVSGSAPGQLLSLLHAWRAHPDADTLSALVFSPAFDRKALPDSITSHCGLAAAVETAGNMGLNHTNGEKAIEHALSLHTEPKDIKTRECILGAAELFRALDTGWAEFIEKYTRPRTYRHENTVFDAAAKSDLCSALRELADSCPPDRRDDIISQAVPELLGRNAGASSRKEGSLFVTTPEGAMLVPGKHLFFCGLSASNFPDKPRENALLLDDDLRRCADAAGLDPDLLPLSEQLTERRAARLEQLAEIYMRRGDSPRFSYSSRDLRENKDENPTSALLDLYVKTTGLLYSDFTGSFADARFFSAGTSPLYEHMRAEPRTCDNMQTAPEGAVCDMPIPTDPAKIRLSPSDYHVWLDCRRKFLFKNILGLKPEKKDSSWLDPMTLGTLIHRALELSANRVPTREQFLELAGDLLERYSALNAPYGNVSQRRAEYMTTAERAYEYVRSGTGEVISSELWLEGVHIPTGITLCGKADCIARTPDGGYVLLDYKTGRNIEHSPDDPTSCVQALIYAYILEHRADPADNISISEGRFVYTLTNKIVSCRWDDNMRSALDRMLGEFAESIRVGDFPRSTDKCTFCDYKYLCRSQTGGDRDA